MKYLTYTPHVHEPWNKGKLLGQKLPLKVDPYPTLDGASH